MPESTAARADYPCAGCWTRPFRPLVAEFFAPWCGHCQRFAPDYESIAKAMKGVIPVVAVDADAHKDAAAEYNVKAGWTFSQPGCTKRH